ncbi:MAG TPA: ABC transporter permease [Pyrinomonadaceae bacterium]|nr:ABC transporter permease [Pyrinomonadaceae bacterium]
MRTLWQDLRYGARTLAKNKGFTLVSVLVLAVGIGANSAIFSVVNAVLLRPLPYPEPERLVVLWGDKETNESHAVVSYPDLEDWRAQTRTLEDVSAFNQSAVLLQGDAEPQPLSGANVSAELFSALRVRPALGRAFTREEDRNGAPPVILIGHGLWQRRFNSDPKIVGQQIRIGGGGVPMTVLGVLPAGFTFPAQAQRTDFLRPMAQTLGERTTMRGSYSMPVLARLKPGVTAREADAEMRAVAQRIEQQYPDEGFRLGQRLVPLEEEVIGSGLRRSLFVLLGAVGLVLLIGCANIAHLLLARAATRYREMAIRTALGASRRRVIRQLLTESLLLSLVGGGLGLLLAMWGVELLVASSPVDIPRLQDVALDARVVAFTLSISVLTGIVFGLAPALQAARVDLNDVLKEGGRGASAGASRSRLRAALVVAEVALSLVLLVGAGLLLKSFGKLTNVDPGFDPQGVTATTVALARQKYPTDERRLATFSEIVARAQNVPGVESAALIYPLPMGGTTTANTFVIEGRPEPAPGDKPSANYRAISPDYFRVMRTRIVRGRAFDARDRADAPPVAIVNESFARRHFAGEEPLGKRIFIERGAADDERQPAREIVGVAADVRHEGLDAPAGAEFYTPFAQAPEASMSLVVREREGFAGASAGVREAIRQVDRDQYVPAVKTMTDLVAGSVARRRFNALLTGLFAAVALLLASIGIFGVTAYTVAMRTHEIGVRMALGARAVDVLRLVVWQGLRLILLGVGLGLLGSLAVTRVLAGMLYGVTPTDAPTFAAVSLLLTAVALAACYVPARRATRVDPMVALRYE